jgi:hypothetical protein
MQLLPSSAQPALTEPPDAALCCCLDQLNDPMLLSEDDSFFKA